MFTCLLYIGVSKDLDYIPVVLELMGPPDKENNKFCRLLESTDLAWETLLYLKPSLDL